MDIATKRLWQLSLLADHQSIETAAEIAGQSKSTIYKSVHEIEEQLDVSLFARLPDGRMLPIEYGEYLCRQVKLSLSELRLALEDILAIQGSLHGRVTIGCLPSMRPFLLPSTLSKLLHEHPDLSIRIEANPFTQMLRGLLSGDIDVIVGGTRSGVNDPGLIVEELARDRVCIIAPKNHPLAQIERLTRRHLSDARWILPLAGTPSRNIFDNCLRQSGVVIPDNCIETGSITTLGGIMQCDDVLTVGTVYQTHRERANGQLTILPFKLKDDDWPLGVTLRRATRPSISSGHLIDYLRTTVRNAVVE
ncbi:MAG: LysR substrate-binding domain-containing protein [Pseudomonadota bacterium]